MAFLGKLLGSLGKLTWLPFASTLHRIPVSVQMLVCWALGLLGGTNFLAFIKSCRLRRVIRFTLVSPGCLPIKTMPVGPTLWRARPPSRRHSRVRVSRSFILR